MPIIAPLKVKQTKKKSFILNLNVYRNAHYHTLNNTKKEYKKMVESQIKGLPMIDVPVVITYKLFPPTRRRMDLSNVLAIHDKYFCDALVELGKLPDDTYEWIPQVVYRFGGVDRSNPRVEISIVEY